MLIGLTSKKGAGKDQAFAFIKEQYPHAERIAFGDLLKKSLVASLGISLDKFELMKNSPRSRVIVLDQNGAMISNVSSREHVQKYGSEGHKFIPEFGSSFWIDHVLPMSFDHINRLVVITDVRYEDEAQRVKDLGGDIILITRKTNDEDNHPTERGLDKYDYLIENNSSLNDYKKKVLAVIESSIFASENYAYSH